MGERLVVVGSAAENRNLRDIARANIELVGRVSDDDLRRYYARCRALVFPGEEDFGIVPLEAQCYGKPVIAFGAGGALESVRGVWASGGTSGQATAEATGVFFEKQIVDCLQEAVRRFSKMTFEPAAIRRYALGFDRKRFKQTMGALIAETVARAGQRGT